MMRNPETSHEEEKEPISEIRVGGGDPIQIVDLKVSEGRKKNLEKGGVEMYDEEMTLSPEDMEKIMKDLSKLPFHIGDPGGTIAFGPEGKIPDGDRPTHEAEVTIAPFISGVPEDKQTYSVSFNFTDPKIWASGFSPHSAKNLEISQPMWSSAQNWEPGPDRENIRVRVGFAPEKPLTIGGKKIEQINLLAQR